MRFFLRQIIALSVCLTVLQTSLRVQAQTGTPKLTLTQVGLHFICTADGQPDMYSWRLPYKDTSPGAGEYDFLIPDILPADLEAHATGANAIVSGGRTALMVDEDRLSGEFKIQHAAPVGFTGSNYYSARLTNTVQVQWRTPAGSEDWQIKRRFYSNYPPLTNSSQGHYLTTFFGVPANHGNYSRYFKNHPGCQAENWNWTLDYDTPLAVNERRIQARLHLEIYHPVQPRSSTNPQAYRYTLVVSKEDLAKIRVNGLPVFNRANDLHFQLTNSRLTHGSSTEEGGLLSARKMGSGTTAYLFMPLSSNFFTVNSTEKLVFSSTGSLSIKVYEGGPENIATQQPIQTIAFQFPQARCPAPELVVTASRGTEYVQPDGTAYRHDAAQAARWWSMLDEGLIGRRDSFSTYTEVKGRLSTTASYLLGLNAVDPRSNTQRVPGAHGLFYGFDPYYYPDVKRVGLAELAADPLKRIAYEAPDFNIPIHYGSDVLRVLNFQGDRTPRATTVPSDFEPEPAYGSEEVFMAPGFAMEQPYILGHPQPVLNVNGPRTARFSVKVDSSTGPGMPPTFQWRRNGTAIPGATQSLLHVLVDGAEDAGSYDVVVTNAKGSVKSNTAELQLTDPVIFTQPQAVRTNVGGKVTFTVGGEGTDLRFQWRRDSLNIAGATASTLVIPKVKLADAGQYDVVLTSSLGTLVSAAVPLEIRHPLAILQQPLGGKVRPGGQVALSVRAVGDGILSYQWRKNGEPVQDAVAYQLVLYGNEEDTAAGTYDVLVSDDSGVVASAKAVVSVLNGLPVIVSHPESEEVTAGSAVQLAVEADGEALAYQWRKNGTNLPKATTATLAITQAKGADGGLYDCVVSNKKGSVLSHSALLTVTGGMTFLVAPADATVLNGGAALFSGKASGDESAVAYQWLFNGKPMAGAAAASLYFPVVDPAKAGLYTLTATRDGEKISASAVLKVDEFGMLIYKVTATGQNVAGGSQTRVALSGFLVADRLNGRASWIWVTKDGKYNRFIVQPLDRFRSDSTGPVAGAQTVFSDMRTESDGIPYSLRIQLWLQGADSLITLAPGSQTRAAKTLSGHLRSLSVAQEGAMRMEAGSVTVSATLDLPGTAHSRLNQEGLDEAVERLSAELVSKGYLETPPQPD